jgi:multiple sugar transport system permease protein
MASTMIATRRPTTRALRGRLRRSDLLPAAGFLAPFLLLLLIFQYIPLALLARNSLYDYTLLNPDAAEFVGFDNFVHAFTDKQTLQSFGVTLLFVAGMLIVVIPTAMALAVYLDGRLPARGIVRVMVFLPVITSSVVVTTMFLFLLGQNGVFNNVLGTTGSAAVPFLTKGPWALCSIILMSAWQQVGLASVLFLAGLQAIPEEVREAAKVDGAGSFALFFRITLPLLSRSTLLIVVLVTVFGLQAFAPPLLMTNGGPDGATNLVVYDIYRTAFQLQQPGFASAISIVLLAFAVLISLVQMRALRTDWQY